MQISGLGAVNHTFASVASKRNISPVGSDSDVVSFSPEALEKSTQHSLTDVLDVSERKFFNDSFGMDVLNAAKGAVSEFASSFMSQQEINFFEQFLAQDSARTLGVSLSV